MTSAADVPAPLGDFPVLRPESGSPLHMQIEQWLTDVIGRGELVPGDRLPPEGDLAVALGVSRMTLRQALATMEAHGTVVRKPGRTGGTYVSQPRIETDLTGLAGFTEQMRRASVRAGARLISATTVRAPGVVAEALSLGSRAKVHEIVRVRTARREPLALERTYLPANVFPDLLDHRLTGSIYDLMSRRYGQVPYKAREVLDPVAAAATEAKLLRVSPDTPLMQIERTTFTAAGLGVEFARDLFRPDRVRISFETGVGSASRAARPN